MRAKTIANNEIELKGFNLSVYPDRYVIKNKNKKSDNLFLGYFTSVQGGISLLISSIIIFAIYLLFSYILSSSIYFKWDAFKWVIVIPILANIPFSIAVYSKLQKDTIIPKQNIEEIIINNKNELVISYLSETDITTYSTIKMKIPKDEKTKQETIRKFKEFDVIKYQTQLS